MEEKALTDFFITQGIFCVLFVGLALWFKAFIGMVMEQSHKREEALRATVDKFGDIIRVDLQEIKNQLK